MENMLDEKLRDNVVQFIARHPDRNRKQLLTIARNTDKPVKFMELLVDRYDLLFPEADLIAKKKAKEDAKRHKAAEQQREVTEKKEKVQLEIKKEYDQREQMLNNIPDDI